MTGCPARSAASRPGTLLTRGQSHDLCSPRREVLPSPAVRLCPRSRAFKWRRVKLRSGPLEYALRLVLPEVLKCTEFVIRKHINLCILQSTFDFILIQMKRQYWRIILVIFCSLISHPLSPSTVQYASDPGLCPLRFENPRAA